MTRFGTFVLAAVAMLTFVLSAAGAEEPRKVSFDNKDSLSGWTITGEAAVDNSKDASGKEGGSLKVPPGAKAIWKLRDDNGTGQVEMSLYDDMAKPKDPKARGVGPRWGLIQKDGRVLVIGGIYAPYLAGDTAYCTSDSDQKSWFIVQHLRANRKEGWHKWTFDFDPGKGLTISFDGKKTNFDWNKTQLKGFVGIAFFGDTAKEDPRQTIWVDDVSVALGAAATTAPAGPGSQPATAASILPDKDPASDKPVEVVATLKDKHPRLLFSAEDVPALKKKAEGPGKPFFEQLMSYLGASKAPPKDLKFQTDATDGQRQGFWRLPTVALHYVLTGDKKSFDATVAFMKVLMDTPDWETGGERNSGMSAANVMIGAALAYDWLYNDLDPDFREAFRKTLWTHARWMYYGGHLGKNPGGGYWIHDPQNNHRFHRDAGMVLCALAAATGAPEEQWLLSKVKDEVQFIADWLPDDGTSHESPSYMIFGNSHLTLFMQACDRCLGTKHLDLPFFKTNPLYRLEICTPGIREIFDYGDSGGLGGYNPYLWELTSVHKLKDEQAGLMQMFQQNKDAFMFGWFSLVWFDPTVTGGSLDNLPRNILFPDLGIVLCRDGWGEKGPAAMFKCGPYGGYKLNKYRNERNFAYINVAHDDPDAGIFELYAGGSKVARDDGYSSKKLTSSHNTILVNGKGQRGEGGGWSQPIKNTDMTKLAYLTTYKASDSIVIAEGEAGGMYPDLTSFRRTFVWVKGGYVLILDNIRAKKEADLAWLVQAKKAEIGDKVFTLTGKDGNAENACRFRVASDAELKSEVVDSTADNHGTPMGLRQIQLKTKGQSWRLASAFDLWDLKKLDVTLTRDGDKTLVKVDGPNFSDTWTLGAPADATSPTPIQGERKGGWTVTVDEKDKAPSGLGGPVANTVK